MNTHFSESRDFSDFSKVFLLTLSFLCELFCRLGVHHIWNPKSLSSTTFYLSLLDSFVLRLYLDSGDHLISCLQVRSIDSYPNEKGLHLSMPFHHLGFSLLGVLYLVEGIHSAKWHFYHEIPA